MNRYVLIAVAAAFTVSCSSPEPQKAVKKAPEKVEPVTALSAFYKMYQLARTWAADVEPLKVESIPLTEMKEQDGAYPAWRVVFVSQTKKAAKSYTYSVLKAGGLYKDVFGGPDESYSGPRGQNSPFSHQGLKVDSDKIIETARKHGAEFTAKHPDMPQIMVAEKTKEHGNPVWRVYWGTSPATSSFSILLDASTGEYLKTLH